MKTAMVLITILLVFIIGLALLKHTAATPSAEGGAIPAIDATTLGQLRQNAETIGGYLSWGVIGASVVMQLSAWMAACRRLKAIKGMTGSAGEKIRQLENCEVYFDLPLYFGLLGTVLSFILITVFPDAGLMFAYVSTGFGIIVSVTLRLVYLTPYRQQLIQEDAGRTALELS